MKTLWIACCLIGFYAKGYSQSATNDSEIIKCIFPDEPAFPGGNDAWMKFVNKNLARPKNIININGRVILSFMVQPDGRLTDLKIVKSLQPEYDKEALRIVKLSSPWKPAIINGKKVESRYLLPVSFDSALKTDTTIYKFVDEAPQFPGGDAAFIKYLGENIRVPKAALKENIQSRFIFKFIVEKDGSLSNPQIIKTLNKAMAKEVLRVINATPKWMPGKLNGRPVRVLYSIPVNIDYAEE